MGSPANRMDGSLYIGCVEGAVRNTQSLKVALVPLSEGTETSCLSARPVGGMQAERAGIGLHGQRPHRRTFPVLTTGRQPLPLERSIPHVGVFLLAQRNEAGRPVNKKAINPALTVISLAQRSTAEQTEKKSRNRKNDAASGGGEISGSGRSLLHPQEQAQVCFQPLIFANQVE